MSDEADGIREAYEAHLTEDVTELADRILNLAAGAPERYTTGVVMAALARALGDVVASAKHPAMALALVLPTLTRRVADAVLEDREAGL